MAEFPCILSQWQSSALGRSLVAAEARLLATTFDDVFGQELLQLGTWGQGRELLAQSRIRRQSVVADAAPGLKASAGFDPRDATSVVASRNVTATTAAGRH